jgi:hypothetical protein
MTTTPIITTIQLSWEQLDPQGSLDEAARVIDRLDEQERPPGLRLVM